ncbi:MAG: DUF2812 domain-containing protein [Eubacteriales bacterium]
MKKEDYLKKVFVYQPYEGDAVEEFLNQMAIAGWMLEEIKGPHFAPYIFSFRKITPSKLTFAVDVFKEATIYDTQPDKMTLDYITYCKEAGWNYVCTKGKIQVFYTEEENPIPIHTDKELKYKTISKAWLVQNWWVLWLPVYCIWMIYFQLKVNFEFVITQYFSVFGLMIYGILIFCSLLLLLDYIKWVMKSRKRIEQKGNLEKSHRKKSSTAFFYDSWLLGILVLLYFTFPEGLLYKLMYVSIVISVGIIFYIHYIYEKRKHAKGINRIIFSGTALLGIYTFIIILLTIFAGESEDLDAIHYKEYHIDGKIIGVTLGHEEIPISMENLGIDSSKLDIVYRGSSAEIKETFLAKAYHYRDYYYNRSGEQKETNYTVFESNQQWILEKYIKDWISQAKYTFTFHKEDHDLWGADIVYELDRHHQGKNIIIAVYGNKVMVMETHLDISYTEEVIQCIVGKLHLKIT